MDHYRPVRLISSPTTGHRSTWYQRLFERAVALLDVDLAKVRQFDLTQEASRLEIVNALGTTPQAYGWERSPSWVRNPTQKPPAELTTVIQRWERSCQELRPVVWLDQTPDRKVERQEVPVRSDRAA